MTKAIVITSGKGGVGKTNISVNTALELAQRNYRTCLLDADLGLANVNILMGLHPTKTLDDYISGESTLEVILLHTQFGFDILPGSSGIEEIANLGTDKVGHLISSFSQLEDYDYFLIDTSSGISKGVISFCLASNETVIVITSESTSLTDAYALLKVIASNGYKGTVKILVNRCPNVSKAKETYLRFKAVVDKHLSIDIAPAGIVLTDPNIELAVTHQEPVLSLYPGSTASQCIRAMVSNLLKSDDQDDSETNFSSFWERYFEFTHADLSLPDSPVSRSTTQSQLPPEIEESAPSHLVLQDELAPSIEEQSSPEPGPIVPFAESDGIIEPLHLASPLPLLAKAFELQRDEELSKDELLDIYSIDPALMVKAIQIHSSPEGRTANRITSIEQLTTDLGTETLFNLLLTVSMQKALFNPVESNPLFVNSHWFHSYKCAHLSQELAQLTKYPYPEEAYLAGLIHDIGRLALQVNYPEAYGELAHILHHDEALLATERTIFGRTHTEIGANSLRAWGLNSFMVDAVQYHDESRTRIETAFDLVKIVYVAHQLTQPLSADTQPEAMLEESILDLTQSQLQECVEKSEEKALKTADRFGIVLTTEEDEPSSNEDTAIFKRQALEYSLLQGVLPSPVPAQDPPHVLHSINKGFEILFGIKPVLCFMPDPDTTSLKAQDYQGRIGCESLQNICISTQSTSSLVAKAYITGEMHIAMEGDPASLHSLGDEQIIRALDSHGLVCVPMVALGITRGVIVFGIQKNEAPKMLQSQTRLEQFGAQSARNLLAAERVSETNDAIPQQPELSHDNDLRGNLIQLRSTK